MNLSSSLDSDNFTSTLLENTNVTNNCTGNLTDCGGGNSTVCDLFYILYWRLFCFNNGNLIQTKNDLMGYGFSIAALIFSASGSVLTKKISTNFDKVCNFIFEIIETLESNKDSIRWSSLSLWACQLESWAGFNWFPLSPKPLCCLPIITHGLWLLSLLFLVLVNNFALLVSLHTSSLPLINHLITYFY